MDDDAAMAQPENNLLYEFIYFVLSLNNITVHSKVQKLPFE